MPASDVSANTVVFRSDHFEAQRLAAMAGMGIALLPSWVVGSDVRSGALLRIGLERERWNEKMDGIWLLRSLTERKPGWLRAFMALLRKQIGSPPIWEP